MSIVAGVDFGTLSVRVSIFDSARGRLGSGVAEYPLLRKKEDPDHATQSHTDHMKALAEATHRAIKDAAIDGHAIESIALDTTGSSVIPVDKTLAPDSVLTGIAPALAGVRAKLEGRYETSDKIAGHLTPEWAEKLGLRAGIPIPVGAFDAHWDALGAGVKIGDVVNVVGTSTCIMAIGEQPTLVPGVCGVVPGSIHPGYTGIEAGLSATGDIFDAIARRANTTAAELSRGLENYRAGETGLLRLTWDNGDRTLLVNPELSGVTLGWRLTHTAQDELFAAIEGTAFHTRVILERMEEYGVPVRRIINAGGIPQRNAVLNQVYANVMGKPILVPKGDVTSLGSAIFAFLAAGSFRTIEEAQDALCPGYLTVEPQPTAAETYRELYALYRKLYFAFGDRKSAAVEM